MAKNERKLNVFVVRPGTGLTLWPQTQITTTTFGEATMQQQKVCRANKPGGRRSGNQRGVRSESSKGKARTER